MKTVNFQSLLVVILILSACTKSGIFPPSYFPGENFTGTNTGLSDAFFPISASLPDAGATNNKANETSETISLPIQKTLELNVSELHRKVKNISWSMNGREIAKGNNARVTLNSIGIGKLSVAFKEVESGKQHNKELKLYAFQQKSISINIKPETLICGKVAIGIKQTLTSFNNEIIGPAYSKSTVQQICSTNSNYSAGIARVAVNIYDRNSTISIDLIEPNEVKNDNSIWLGLLFFWIKLGESTKIIPKTVYQTSSFSASATNNFSNGTYTLGNTTLTIED